MNITIDGTQHKIEKAETFTRQEPKPMTGGHLGANVVAFVATLETHTITTGGEVFVIADVIERPRGTARMIPTAIRMTQPFPANEPPIVNAVATFPDGQEVAVLLATHPRPPEAVDAVLEAVRGVDEKVHAVIAYGERTESEARRQISETRRVIKERDPEAAEVMDLYAGNKTQRDVAAAMNCSVAKVNKIVARIRRAYGIDLAAERYAGGEHTGDTYRHNGHARDRKNRPT